MEVFSKAISEWGRQQDMVGAVLPLFSEWKNVRNAGIHGRLFACRPKQFVCKSLPSKAARKGITSI